jgi:long-subunit fatty acid transport protein
MILKTIRPKIIISLLALSGLAYADVNHYKNILVGDRAATMGGAFAAVANDTSGTYYNPSGIAFYDGGGLSATANVYHLQYSTYKKAIRNNDWNRNSDELVPNFFGIIKTWGRSSFGASIAVPDSFTQNQDQILQNLPATSTGDAIKMFAFNLHTQDSTYLIGPSYSYRINDKMAVGLTLSYHYRKNRTLNYETIWYTDTDYEVANNVIELSENGLEPKLGFLMNITDKLSAGFVLNHTYLISSKYTDQATSKARSSNDMILTKQELKNKRNTTTHIGLGTAYRPIEPLLLTLDFDVFTAPEADIFSPSGYKNVFNFSLGGEYKINQRNTVRLGLFTNKSNMPEPTKDTFLVSHVDMYGISTGYSLTYAATTFTFGLVYSAGSGYSQVYAGTSEVVKTFTHTLTGIISTSYNFN